MEKISRVSIGVFVVFLLLPPWAHALEVGMARLQDGEVRVMGKGARKGRVDLLAGRPGHDVDRRRKLLLHELECPYDLHRQAQ